MPEGCNAILDHYIGMNGSSLSGNDLKVILDFKLFHQFDTNEMSFLNGIVISNRLELLKHPVCESFLSMKWLRVKKFFYFYVTLLGNQDLMIFLFPRNCPKSTKSCKYKRF